MKLAIVGSRKFSDYEAFKKIINENFHDGFDTIISGGAKGVDTLAEIYAHKYNIPIVVLKPDYKKYHSKPKYAPLARNKIIAEQCDKMIAFIYDDSNGTKYTIQCAYDFSKPVIIIDLEKI